MVSLGLFRSLRTGVHRFCPCRCLSFLSLHVAASQERRNPELDVVYLAISEVRVAEKAKSTHTLVLPTGQKLAHVPAREFVPCDLFQYASHRDFPL